MSSRCAPTVLASLVVRSAHKGESHGAVYLVDLEHETRREVVRWTRDIDWSGRGFDRGLRGIAFHGGLTYIAASDEILAYDQSFQCVGRHRCRYLRHCHEIAVDGDELWATSTGFDSLLCLDLGRQCWTRGICLRRGWWQQITRRLLPARRPRPRFFDPAGDAGPEPGDTVHLNTVHLNTVHLNTVHLNAVHLNAVHLGTERASDGVVYCSGTGIGCMLRLEGRDLTTHARVPLGTHNVRPYRGGVLMNLTPADVIRHAAVDGTVLEQWKVPVYDEQQLINHGMPADHARQGFGRGLCVSPDGDILGGSSPATISRYVHGRWSAIQSFNLSLDIRHAIHGLEVYPYDPSDPYDPAGACDLEPELPDRDQIDRSRPT